MEVRKEGGEGATIAVLKGRKRGGREGKKIRAERGDFPRSRWERVLVCLGRGGKWGTCAIRDSSGKSGLPEGASTSLNTFARGSRMRENKLTLVTNLP